MAERGGIRRVLELSWFYTAFQRGKHVRTLDGYRDLAAAALPHARVDVRALSGQLRVPYDHSVLTACES